MDRAVEIGDFFNETDSDTERQVIGICATKDPPVVISRPYKNAADADDEDDGSESTEEEYCMAYEKNATTVSRHGGARDIMNMMSGKSIT